jgi:hypothetical protein
MRKWWIFWPLYAGLMGFTLGASFFFGLYGRNVTEGGIAAQHEQKASEETTKPEKGGADEAIAFYTLWLMAFTGILALATIGLGGATVLLYATGEKQFRFAIRSSVRQSRDMQSSIAVAKQSADAAMISAQTSKVAIRAIVTIKNFIGFCNTPNGVVESYGFWPRIENVGSTNATCTLICSINLVDINDEAFVFIPPSSLRGQVAVIGPTMTISPSQPLGMTITDAVRVWRGEIRFLLYCRVDYRDMFDEPHHAECCVSVGFQGDPTASQEWMASNQRAANDFVTYTPWGPQNTVS